MNALEIAKKEEIELCYEIIDLGRRFQQEQGVIQCGVIVFQESDKLAYDKVLR